MSGDMVVPLFDSFRQSEQDSLLIFFEMLVGAGTPGAATASDTPAFLCVRAIVDTGYIDLFIRKREY